jgi:diguanylate cyclase (GGDEF)-like protein
MAARRITIDPATTFAVTASFGVAAFAEPTTPAELFAAADEALYRAKSAGKNCVVSTDVLGAVRARQ